MCRYNEEAYILSGSIDIGNKRVGPEDACYVPAGTTAQWHSTVDGCLCFVRVDRDLGTVPPPVVSVKELPQPKIDWTTSDVSSLPGPDLGVVPSGFVRHLGTWEVSLFGCA